MLKGRKQKFSERFPAHEMKATIPVLMSTPLAARLKKLADEITSMSIKPGAKRGSRHCEEAIPASPFFY